MKRIVQFSPYSALHTLNCQLTFDPTLETLLNFMSICTCMLSAGSHRERGTTSKYMYLSCHYPNKEYRYLFVRSRGGVGEVVKGNSGC